MGVKSDQRQKRKNVDLDSSLGQQFKPTQPAGPPPPHLLNNACITIISRVAVAARWATAEDELKVAIDQQFADACAH